MSGIHRPAFREALRFWTKLGWISFGGPAGQIAVMHQEVVERRRWIDEGHFLHALNYCMLLPGPEATQLAIYIGWLLHGGWGGMAAGLLFILPSAVILWGLSWAYIAFGAVPAVEALFYGLKPAVLAIVAAAVLKIGSKVLKTPAMWGVAALALVAIAIFRVPFPAVVAGAAMLGVLGERLRPGQFAVLRPEPVAEASETAAPVCRYGWGRAFRVLALGLALWWAPVLAALAWQGPEGTLFQQGLFFSKAAMLTFGGAYAVLPYVSQQAVEHFRWLQPGQMLDGLGLAETTPGPLIMVLEFVGFVGGWQNPGALAPWLAATLGAAMTFWATFAPSFLFIFLGAPYVEKMRGNLRLAAALSAVTAAIVGVIVNLALWFGHHLLWPEGGRFDLFALGLASVVFAGLARWQWGLFPVIVGSSLAGLLWRLLA